MKLLFDFFPVLLFFICYKFFGLYIATATAMIASLLQVIIHRIKYRKYEKLYLISAGMIIVLGGATLIFHNPLFIKWKPTGIYWISSVVFMASSFVGKKPLIQKMMGSHIKLPSKIWTRLNIAWATFFMLMGALNIYVAYYFDTNFWVTFKLFGGAGCTLFFVFIQSIFLTKYVTEQAS